jgi:hypothetical protein
VTLLVAVGCGTGGEAPGPETVEEPGPPAAGTTELVAGLALDEPVSIGPLVVWPVLGRPAGAVGDVTTLEAAQAAGSVVVREVGVRPEPETAQADHRGQQLVNVLASNASFSNTVGGSARVNTLEIENRGDVPLLVCAGTVLVGGKQDRQVGEDLVIAAGETLEIPAFCVEQGRWTETRGGAGTAGRFQASGFVAAKRVRASAQYAVDQGEVWRNVSVLNSRGGTRNSTSTFLAAVEGSGEAARERRRELEKVVLEHLTERARIERGEERVLGFAYAIHGEPIGVRVFATEELCATQLPTFARTMSLEAELVEQRDRASGREPARVEPDPGAIVKLVRGIEGDGAGERRTEFAWNSNVKRTSEWGGRSDCRVPTEAGEPVSLTRDWTAPLAFTPEVAAELDSLGYTGGD